jgi:hypothetical protein
MVYQSNNRYIPLGRISLARMVGDSVFSGKVLAQVQENDRTTTLTTCTLPTHRSSKHPHLLLQGSRGHHDPYNYHVEQLEVVQIVEKSNLISKRHGFDFKILHVQL